MHRIDVLDLIDVRCLIVQQFKASAASNTCSMVRKQRRGICNINKLIRQRYSGLHM
jgi:hypothetical protein